MSSSFRNTWVYPSGITELILPEHLSSVTEGCDYDKRNISVVNCDTYIPQWSTNLW
jgi:hypothetical protein